MKTLSFGERLIHPLYGIVRFIHYDNHEKTKCTIDQNGLWYHVEVKTLKKV